MFRYQPNRSFFSIFNFLFNVKNHENAIVEMELKIANNSESDAGIVRIIWNWFSNNHSHFSLLTNYYNDIHTLENVGHLTQIGNKDKSPSNITKCQTAAREDAKDARTFKQATPTGVYMTLSEAADTRDAQHCVSPVSKDISVIRLFCFYIPYRLNISSRYKE